ncbi:MAG: hypothetical protein SFU91_14285 [Chloroherpetonaceae bacterium]|nr:hypothetical protein [Chloroherpetonaceae bacterium]
MRDSIGLHEHYVLRANSNRRNQLVLFLGGTSSVPKHYSYLCEFLVNKGFDVISLSYLNSVSTLAFKDLSDSLAFTRFREEVTFGTPISPLVQVDSLSSIYSRVSKLLNYLIKTHPESNWSIYLTSSGEIDWSKIAVSGHSQGAGHACFLGKKFHVQRVVMFAGPNDYSTYFKRPASWLRAQGRTPLFKQFSIIHPQDEYVPYEWQLENLKGLGILRSNDSLFQAANENLQLIRHQVISVGFNLGSPHAVPVGSHPSMPAIWSYVFFSHQNP